MYHKQSDNVSGGDNQQETNKWLARVLNEIGFYISGFSDGEGSFNVSIRRHPGYKLGWKTSLTFNVSQKGKRSLELIKKIFRSGYVRKRADGLHYFEIVDFKKLIFLVIPFFEKFKLRSEKKEDFGIFKEVAFLMKEGRHLTKEGLLEILTLRGPMNSGGKKRRFNSQRIITSLLGSSETIRRTSPFKAEGMI